MITLASAIRRCGPNKEVNDKIHAEYKARRIKMREKIALDALNKGKHRRSRNRRKQQHVAVVVKKGK